MESLESVMWIFVGAGVILVSTAVLGGGVEVKEIKIPKLNPRVRFLAAILGVVFIMFPVVLPALLSKPRINSFQAIPSRIKTGESSRINWSVSRAITVNIQPEIGEVSLSGSSTISPPETTTYTLIAKNDAGMEVVRTITVQVEPLLLPVVNLFKATPSRIKAGERPRINWSVSQAVTVNIQPEIGDVSLSGSSTISPSETTTYTLTAKNEAGKEVVERTMVRVQPLAKSTKEGFVRIFNGKDLSGWETNQNKGTFSVRNGMIVVKGDRSHLFYVGPIENAKFRNFEFKADVMTEPGANSGIFFHTTYQAMDWPNKGYEVQINNTHSDWRKTGSLWNIQDVSQSIAKDNEWFTIHIIVRDKRIIIRVNGETTVDYIEPENVNRLDLPKRRLSVGTFALQGIGQHSVVYYKNIMVRVPPSEAWQSIEDDRKEGFIRIFNGKDLIGWEANENKDTFRVRDGMIVANGDRSHLFYVGAVGLSSFRNFEFKADIMTKPGANGGVYFHTAYPETGWPTKGYEAQISNTGDDSFDTGSLWGVRESTGPLPKDNEWFTLNIIVQNRQIIIKVNNETVVNYTEPKDFYDPDLPERKLSSGTFALQGFNPESTIYYKNIMVKPLPTEPR
jgi:hypothetical protein